MGEGETILVGSGRRARVLLGHPTKGRGSSFVQNAIGRERRRHLVFRTSGLSPTPVNYVGLTTLSAIGGRNWWVEGK